MGIQALKAPGVAQPAELSTRQAEAPKPPHTVEREALAALQLLLRVESEARETASISELQFLIANETSKLSCSEQTFVVSCSGSGNCRIEAVSSVAVKDRNAPLTQSIERLLKKVSQVHNISETVQFEACDFVDHDLDTLQTYPFSKFLWIPFTGRTGKVFAGMLQARETGWPERDRIVSERLAGTYAHAWTNHSGRREPNTGRLRKGQVVLGTALALMLAMLVPVPMSALAPAEIVAQEPFVVSAPIDGVIEDILVEPNSPVKPGQVLFTYSDTTLRNKFEIASREVLVARAKLKRSNQLAFQDVQGRHELGIARSELQLRISERNFAAELLKKSVVKAEQAGIAMFGDKKDLIGKPVSTGERMLELADPQRVLMRIDMPVMDGQLLKVGSASKVFLDSDPLRPLNARIVRADYRATTNAGDSISFRAFAELDLKDRDIPRLGVRGTAQVYGDDVPLGLYLFRRPIVALRQWIGM